jgi:hypothetical protein
MVNIFKTKHFQNAIGRLKFRNTLQNITIQPSTIIGIHQTKTKCAKNGYVRLVKYNNNAELKLKKKKKKYLISKLY